MGASRATLALSTLLAMISWLVRLLLRPSRPAAETQPSCTREIESYRHKAQGRCPHGLLEVDGRLSLEVVLREGQNRTTAGINLSC